MPKTVTVPLPSGDWGEIYYALESKVTAIQAGFYDPEDNEGDNAAWITHLKSIMRKIQSKVEV